MKKWASLVLAALVIFTFTINAFADTVTGSVYSDQNAPGQSKPVSQIQQELEDAGIKDVDPNAWYAGSVTVLVENGLLLPDENGNFNPNGTLIKEDAGAIFAKVLGIADMDDTPEEAYNKAVDAGLIDPDISPEGGATRIFVARLIAAGIGVDAAPISDPAVYPFSDFNSLTAPDRGTVAALYDLGIFIGYPQAGEKPAFKPLNALTRAQIAILVDRLLGGI